MILKELQIEFGGSAEAAGGTFAGQLDILRNNLLNVAETAGTALMPALTEAFQTITPYIAEFAQKFADFVASDRFQEWVETAVSWLKNDLPQGIARASDFWNNELRPAIDEFWPILRDDLLPAMGDLAEFLGTVLPPLLKLTSEGWQIQIGAIKLVKQWVDNQVTSFNNLRDAVKWVIEKIEAFKEKLGQLELPDWLVPGSPTPFELGLRGINDAMGLLNGQGLADFNMQIAGTARAPIAASLAAGIGPVSGGGGGAFQFVYAPLVSTADEYEARRVLGPIIEAQYRELTQR
jgi:hypothetical protein